MCNHKWTQTQKLEHFTRLREKKRDKQSNNTTAVDTISVEKLATAAPNVQHVCIFINCFMSRRYLMSLKHACLLARCVRVSFPLSLAVRVFAFMFIVYVNERTNFAAADGCCCYYYYMTDVTFVTE